MSKNVSDMSRRHMLKALALGGAAGAVASVSAPAAAAAPKQVTQPKSDKYRETEHVRSYYASLSK
ncbi:twin-arginine translocation signal domain-containing protein [Shewanella maritima]|uniref:twin-arginine translocation signal domain-containing protein n=1 Tax=Shewanella maritima TaxID=2520507 RepID=UPI00373517D2